MPIYALYLKLTASRGKRRFLNHDVMIDRNDDMIGADSSIHNHPCRIDVGPTLPFQWEIV